MRDPLLIFLLVLAVTGPAIGLLAAGDLSYVEDARRLITDDPAVTAPSSVRDILSGRSSPVPGAGSGSWLPVRTADLALDLALFGATPSSRMTVWWTHLRDVLCHAGAVLLLLALFRRWGAGRGAAFAGALVFALHPVQVETFASGAGRGDLLCAVFLLCGLLLHSTVRRFSAAGVLAALAFALALLSKEAAVVFLPCAMLSDWFFRDGRKARVTLRRWPTWLLYALVTAGWVFESFRLLGAGGAEIRSIPGRWGGTALGAVLTLARILAYYLRLVILPVDMAFDFHLWEVRRPDLLSVLIVAGLGLLLAWSVRRAAGTGGPGPFAVLWAALALLPVSHLVLPLAIPTAERFLYLPMIGIALFAGEVLARAARSGLPGAILAGAVIACLGGVSAERAAVWRRDGVLWSATQERVRSPRALVHQATRAGTLGGQAGQEAQRLLDAGRTEEARVVRERSLATLGKSLALYDEALVLWSRCPAPGPRAALVARAERALTLFGLQRHQEALEEADAVIRGLPGLAEAHYARALALLGLGRMREAALEIEIALVTLRSPEALMACAAINEKLAIEYEARGNRAFAYRGLRRSWQIYHDPIGNAGVRKALDEMQAEYDGRAKLLEEQVLRQPSDGDAWLELATLHAQYGEYARAGPIYRQLLGRAQGAVRRDIMYHYALYFWQWRDTPDAFLRAAVIYEEILRSEPGLEEVRRQLEICREKLGDG